MEEAGAVVVEEPVICNNEPDDAGLAQQGTGEALATA